MAEGYASLKVSTENSGSSGFLIMVIENLQRVPNRVVLAAPAM